MVDISTNAGKAAFAAAFAAVVIGVGVLAGFFDSALGNVMFAVGNILVFTVLICWSARALSRAEIERKSAEEALHRQQTELEVLFDLIPAMIWFKDTKNGILRVNKRAAEAIGKSVGEIEGTSSPEKYYADDLEVIQSGAPKLGIIETIRNQAGKESWVETDKVPYRDQEGKIVGIVVMAHDITESKRVDETVRRLASIVENSSEAIIGRTLTGIITSWNPAAEKMFGYTASEIMGQPLQVLIPPDRLKEESQVLAGFARGELVRHFETVRVRKDGQRIDVSATISPIKDADGKIVGASKIVRDITERKRVEAELAFERDLLRALLENSPDNIYFKDTESRFIKTSKAQARQFGLDSPEEMVGKTDFDFFSERRARSAYEDEQEIMRTDRPVIAKAERELWQDGRKESWVLTTKMPLRDKEGKIIGTFGISKDITAIKKIETDLTHERDLLKALLDNVPDTIYFKDLQSRFVRVSKSKTKKSFEIELARHRASHPAGSVETLPAHLTSLERFDDYLTGKTDFDLVSGKKAREFFEQEQEVIRTGTPLIGKLIQTTIEDGREEWVIVSRIPWRDKEGKIVGVFGISKDITALKQVEAELAYQSDLFGTLINHSPDSIFFKDLQSRFVALSRSEVNHLWQIALSCRTPHPAGEEERLPPHLASVEAFGKYVIGKSDAEFYGPERAVDFDRDEKEVMRTGRVISGKVERTIHHDGSDSYYLVTKVPWRDKEGKIIGVFGTGKNVTELKRAEAAVAETNALLEALLQNTPDHIYFKDLQSRFIHFSREMLKHFHLSEPDELKGRTDFDFFSEEHARPAYEAEQEIIRTDKPIFNLEERETLLDGQVAWVLTSKMPRHDKDGKVIGTMGISRDITERKGLETQLFQAQKMEIVGKLAGGVAHEFNSILTTIIGQSELLLGDLPSGSPLNKSAAEINQAAGRAAALTQQLLAYGRKQTFQTETLDLNSVLAGMEGALRHLLGGDSDVRIIPAAGLQAVKADAGQIEQVIMNMAINAHDAMPRGGKFTLETSNVSFDQENAGSYPDLKPGDYVMLAVTDTGTGMSLQVQARVFEPFFSTKGIGEGAGLGLSTCYGIIKQSGGNITVHSEPGQGTRFKIYLPQVKQQAALPLQRLDSADLPRGTETILLVGDDPTLREMAAALLERLGYTVLTAANGTEALGLAQQRDIGPIDLLFTDVVMPHMSVKQLAEQARALNPRTKVLFVAAYTENDIAYQGLLNKDVGSLREPYTPSELAHKLREVLDT